VCVATILSSVRTSRSNVEIGAVLGKAERTVNSHLYVMMKKTNTRNRVGLVLVLLHISS
jgi:DNA-binding CsgD family transcriptional regulator